jgi:DNA-binding response OmpR family regulator
MPKMDGTEVCKAIRQISRVPIMMLTAKTDELDKILGLELGADDYVTKPFSVREIITRIRTILRRLGEKESRSSLRRIGQLEINLDKYEVLLQGRPVGLSPKEFDFLKYLMKTDGRALSRDALIENVWGHDAAMNIDTRTVDQHLARLRKKLGGEAHRLITIKNIGYRFKQD